jgi:beta-lactamase regulating signal transducer with metallopeptidase domain
MNTFLSMQPLAQLSAERIVNCTAEGMIIMLLAGLLLRAIGPRNSGTRFAVWFAALLGIAALPLVGGLARHSQNLTTHSEIALPASWALYVFTAWAAVATLGLLRVGVGFWHLHRLRRQCAPVDVATLDPVLQKTLAEFEPSRAVTLCLSDDLRVPTAIGFSKPLVVIPSWTMRELSTPELNAILLHELAHIRRRDDWTNLAQKILGALLFFHPAVWWIERKLALEREMACDDLVLAETKSTNARAYAECLVSLAEKSFLRRGIALAQAAVDRLRNVSLRVTRILDVNRPRATRIWSPALVLLGGTSFACLLALSQAPMRLVSFDNTAASLAANASAGDGLEGSQLSEMGVHFVPAKLQVREEREKRARAPAAKPSHKNSRVAVGKADIVPDRIAQRRVKEPMIVRASLTMNPGSPHTLFVMTRTEFVEMPRYDASGAAVWELSVWQVTVIGPVHQTTTTGGTAPKSI